MPSPQSSVRVRVLVTALLERLCGGEMDYAKASRLFSDAADAAASIAALDFLLCGAGAPAPAVPATAHAAQPRTAATNSSSRASCCSWACPRSTRTLSRSRTAREERRCALRCCRRCPDWCAPAPAHSRSRRSRATQPAARLQRWRVLSPLSGGAPKLELSLEVGGRREEVSLGGLDQARLLLHELRQAQAAMAALSSQPESAADEASIEREGGEREDLEES